ncbi:MAG: universal stress protein [Thermoleophilia bacterium]|nr:universal stress protein [Thermoleophilia bacterium]
MDRLETMLLSTDGSEFSQGAVRTAVSLAGRCSSRLIAMTVVEVHEVYVIEAPELVQKEVDRATGSVLAQVKKADSAGIKWELVVKVGDDPWSLIISEAERNGAELIVMGRRGRTGLARMAMGSVTAKVIGHAPCNVLVVPREADIECGTIIAATDGSVYGEAAIREALKMAAVCGSRLVVLSVAESDSDLQEAETIAAAGRQAAEGANIESEALTASGKPYGVILSMAEEKNADLIVMGCRGRTGLSRLLMGSVAERVIAEAQCAVLVACASVAQPE